MKVLTCGVGVNDYAGRVSAKMDDGTYVIHAFYVTWRNMLKRCYSTNCHGDQPTYVGCTVCNDWLSLSKFKEWHDANYVEGWAIDKDILEQGNKIYSPEFCRYVPQPLNNLMLDCGKSKGRYPLGVTFDRQQGKFRAKLRVDGKTRHLGSFTSAASAQFAYNTVKRDHVLSEVAKYRGSVCSDLLDSVEARYR